MSETIDNAKARLRSALAALYAAVKNHGANYIYIPDKLKNVFREVGQCVSEAEAEALRLEGFKHAIAAYARGGINRVHNDFDDAIRNLSRHGEDAELRKGILNEERLGDAIKNLAAERGKPGFTWAFIRASREANDRVSGQESAVLRLAGFMDALSVCRHAGIAGMEDMSRRMLNDICAGALNEEEVESGNFERVIAGEIIINPRSARDECAYNYVFKSDEKGNLELTKARGGCPGCRDGDHSTDQPADSAHAEDGSLMQGELMEGEALCASASDLMALLFSGKEIEIRISR